MMKSGCHKCDSLKLLLCVKPVIKVLLRHHRNKNYPLCGRVHHDYGKMTRHICPGRVPVEVWGLEEAERLSGLLGHSNIKCKGMKHWWPSSPFSCKTRRNIKLSLKYMTQRWLFVCSSSVLTSHVRLCCCSKEDDLVHNMSALLWKTVYEWLNSESLLLSRHSVPQRISVDS